MKKRLFFISLLLLTTLSIAQAESIKIGVIFAKTGRAAEVGRDFFKAINLIVDDMNKTGGVLNKQIELLEYDNFSKPLNSKEAAMKAVQDNVVAVIGASWSSNTKAMAEVLQDAEIPMITPLATNPDVTKVGNYIFRTCFIDSFQGQVMASFAINALRAKSAAVFINASSSFSRSLAQEFSTSFKQQNGMILYTGEYLKQDNDFSTLLKKAIQIKPDIVYLSGYSRDSGFIIKQAHKMGLSSTFLGGDGWNQSMYKYGNNTINGNYYTNHWHEDLPNPVSKSLIQKYNDFKVKSRLALGHDAIMVLIDAIRSVKSVDSSKIRDAIASTTDFQGATGNITFNEIGDPLKPAVILQFSNGKTKFINAITP